MNENKDYCQVEEYKSEEGTLPVWEKIWLDTKDVLRGLKKALVSLRQHNKKQIRSKPRIAASSLKLQSGEKVKIKSREDILKTLDQNGRFQGCQFTAEMWQYCGGEYEVFKKVESFLNETNNRIQKISDTVLLKDVYCSGKRAFGERCDRSCFLFWKEIWLERLG